MSRIYFHFGRSKYANEDEERGVESWNPLSTPQLLLVGNLLWTQTKSMVQKVNNEEFVVRKVGSGIIWYNMWYIVLSVVLFHVSIYAWEIAKDPTTRHKFLLWNLIFTIIIYWKWRIHMRIEVSKLNLICTTWSLAFGQNDLYAFLTRTIPSRLL